MSLENSHDKQEDRSLREWTQRKNKRKGFSQAVDQRLHRQNIIPREKKQDTIQFAADFDLNDAIFPNAFLKLRRV